MLFSEYCPAPMSDIKEIITRPYVFKSLDYVTALTFHKFFKMYWPYCDYSEVCEDVELVAGKPRTSWFIYFNMRPQDVKRLEFVMYKLEDAKRGLCYTKSICK